jgi:DNA replication initiation complex subunit (GINS family)
MYAELYAAWQHEVENASLQPLPVDFYARLSDYLRRIRDETRALDKKTLRAILLEREQRNVSRIVKELLRARFQKLVKTIGENQKIPSDLLTAEETKICESVVAFAEAYRALTKNLMEGQTLTIKPATIEELAASSEELEKPTPHHRVALRFLKAIPAIIGGDLKTYGPFAVEDVASVPAENAKILVKHGLAVVVEVS